MNENGKTQAEREKVLSSSDKFKVSGEAEKLKINRMKFDTFFKGQNIDFIKIDVEGHEVEILSSIIDYVKQIPSEALPHILFEHENRNYNHREIERMGDYLRVLKDFGYEVLVAATEKSALEFFSKCDYPIQIHCRPVLGKYPLIS